MTAPAAIRARKQRSHPEVEAGLDREHGVPLAVLAGGDRSAELGAGRERPVPDRLIAPETRRRRGVDRHPERQLAPSRLITSVTWNSEGLACSGRGLLSGCSSGLRRGETVREQFGELRACQRKF